MRSIRIQAWVMSEFRGHVLTKRIGNYCLEFDFSPLCLCVSETMHGFSLSKEDSERLKQAKASTSGYVRV